jgi:poly(A) polymerase
VTGAADSGAAAAPALAAAEWLRAGPLARLLAVLNGDGEEARVVGGAVRNTLLGLPPGDVDVATTALPQEVTRRVQAAGMKPVPTGIEHGTVTVVVDGHPFEVTTLREDVETFGRKATVRFGRDWKADAERRDFTINALSVAADGAVSDYVEGLRDLRVRRVRFIGDPGRRIREDYLRILRFFRFHASYGAGEPDPASLQACIVERGGLGQLSRERVRMELIKLLVAPRAAPVLTVMADTGLLVTVLAGVPNVAHFEAMARSEASLGLAPDAVRRLAALAVLTTEDAERLWQRLRLSNVEHERLASMADRWWSIAPSADPVVRPLLYGLGPDQFADRVLLAWARSRAAPDDPGWRALVSLPRRWQAPRFPLKARDFMQRGLEGPQLGAALRAAEAAWIAADFPGDATALERIADDAAGGSSRAQGST